MFGGYVRQRETLRSAEHAAMFCPDGSNLQLKISAECEPAKLMIGASRALVR